MGFHRSFQRAILEASLDSKSPKVGGAELSRSLPCVFMGVFSGEILEDSSNSKSPKVGGFRGREPRSEADRELVCTAKIRGWEAILLGDTL
jgi:hypothetical protein